MKNFIILSLVLSVFAACSSSVATEDAQTTNDSITARRAIKVRTKTLKAEHFEHRIEANGAVEAKQSAFISPEIGGQVKKIHVTEGQRVSKGQLLVSLNSTALNSQLEELKSGSALAETIFRKQKELWDQKIGSEIQFLEAKNRRESLDSKIKAIKAQIAMTQITAPFSGIVDEIHPHVGELASPGQPLLDLVNLQSIAIIAEVSEAHLQTVNKGDKALVTFPNFQGFEAELPIKRKGNIINQANRTFKIEVVLKNKNEQFKPNQIATLMLRDYVSDSTLLVPAIVIRKDLKGDYVFKVSNQGNDDIASKQYIKTGRSYDGNTEVLGGLKNGDNVLIEGYNLVRNGSYLEIL